MDIDYLKTASEDDQIHDIMLMMNMDKLPDQFSSPYTDVNELPVMDVNTPGSTSGAIAQPVDDPNVASSALMHQSASIIAFGSSPPIQQHVLAMNFLPNSSSGRWRNELADDDKRHSMAAMREVIFRIAAMQPIHIDPESVKPPKRRNVKISKDPQSVAARHRRERISERIRIFQRLVPGGTKLDTASMLDEAIHYVKFLKDQVQSLERAAANRPAGTGLPIPMSAGSYLPTMASKSYQASQNIQHYADA